jgi:TetR/AcrR family transcriptional repressor of nem operon
LGYAVVDEVLMGHFQTVWEDIFQQHKNPLTTLQQMFVYKAESFQNADCFNGCPLNNLNQEMAAIDDGFHQRLEKVFENAHMTIVRALEKGQADGLVRKDINPVRISMFIFSSYQGIMGAAKCMQAPELLSDLFGTLNDYIDTLRVPEKTH